MAVKKVSRPMFYVIGQASRQVKTPMTGLEVESIFGKMTRQERWNLRPK